MSESIVELAGNGLKIFESSKPDEKNQLLKLLVSNCILDSKKARISLSEPFNLLLKIPSCPMWSWRRDWLDFFFKNLRRCVGFFRRYSRLACAYSPVLLRKLALLRSLYFASVTRFVNSPRFAHASLLINKTSPLVVKTTFRGCFYPRALSSRVRTLLHAIYKRKKATKNGGFLCLWSCIWHVLKESQDSELPWS